MRSVMVGLPAPPAHPPPPCRALWDYDPQSADEIALTKGDVLQVADVADDGWWDGTIIRQEGAGRDTGGRGGLGASGLFPYNYVQVRDVRGRKCVAVRACHFITHTAATCRCCRPPRQPWCRRAGLRCRETD